MFFVPGIYVIISHFFAIPKIINLCLTIDDYVAGDHVGANCSVFIGIFVWTQSGDHLLEDVEKGTIIPKKI
jgi:hypothetical protein